MEKKYYKRISKTQSIAEEMAGNKQNLIQN